MDGKDPVCHQDMLAQRTHILALPRGTVTTEIQQEKLKEFVVFVAYVYCDWSLRCQSAYRTPGSDLTLYTTLLKYKAVNQNISTSSLKALKRHL